MKSISLIFLNEWTYSAVFWPDHLMVEPTFVRRQDQDVMLEKHLKVVLEFLLHCTLFLACNDWLLFMVGECGHRMVKCDT